MYKPPTHRLVSNMAGDYERAVAILNSKRRLGRPNTDLAADNIFTKKMPSLNGRPDLRGTPSLTPMSKWLQLLGHSDSDINALNVIHVAGTKGKGSTCAFTESILRAHGRRVGFPAKTGLYTSPHLIFPEERIRINFQPLSRRLFAQYFFEVYNHLAQSLPGEDFRTSPRYLQLFALVSYHTFIRERVDVAIYETHHGGEYDATNVVRQPIVTAIAALGMDHVSQLGPSLENIAWHKAGIFKSGAKAISTVQDPRAEQVLRDRAAENKIKLEFVDIDSRLPQDNKLQTDVQKKNCSLALACSESFLERRAPDGQQFLAQEDVAKGVQQFAWPGRFQTIVDGSGAWFLDGAHNDMSVAVAAKWFAEATAKASTPRTPLILIFSHISTQRDGANVLKSLATSLLYYGVQVDHLILSTYMLTAESTSNDLCLNPSEMAPSPETQQLYTEYWRKIDSKAKIWNEPTIEGALNLAKKIGNGEGCMHTLITGSQHLIGGALRLFGHIGASSE